MSLHNEISFETEVCSHLAANGWLYEEGDAGHYDRARALFPADVLAWVQASQPQAWEAAANRGSVPCPAITGERQNRVAGREARSVSKAERGLERGREASRAHGWLKLRKAPNDVLARALAAMGVP